MKLGIVVTEANRVQDAVNLMGAASERGWELRCFLTDSGVRAIEDAQLQALVRSGKSWLAVCELSVERYGMEIPPVIAGPVIIGGQYQDAELVHWCDKVAVF